MTWTTKAWTRLASNWTSKRIRTRTSKRRTRAASISQVEPLEGRALLSMGGVAMPYVPPMAHVARTVHERNEPEKIFNNGLVIKQPHFYEDFAGPFRQDLNVRAAMARVVPGRGLVLRGLMNARIDTSQSSVFVFGIDRNGHLPTGPFPGRPDIRFDAVVVVNVSPTTGISGSVVDLASGARTNLPAGSVSVRGATVQAVVDPRLLPSTGLPLSQYRFNLWPRTSLGAPNTIASFAPEFTTARIGTPNGRG